MSDEIIKVLDALSDKLGVAVDWTSENVLPQLETLGDKAVHYELCTSVMWLALGGLMVLAGIVLPIWLWYLVADQDEEIFGVLFMFATIMVILGGFVVVNQIEDIILCNVFPEKVIYELVKTVMK